MTTLCKAGWKLVYVMLDENLYVIENELIYGLYVVCAIITGWKNKLKNMLKQDVNALKICCKWAENRLKVGKKQAKKWPIFHIGLGCPRKNPCKHLWWLFFLELHSTTSTPTIRTHTHPYKHTYANPTPISTFERLSRQILKFTKSAFDCWMTYDYIR